MKIGFIGAGNMGGALAKAVANDVGGENVYVCDQDFEKAKKVADSFSGNVADCNMVWNLCDYVFLGVKPQVLEKAVNEIVEINERRDFPVVISMAAGVSIEKIEKMFGEGKEVSIIRIMPNTPVKIGYGVTFFCYNRFVSNDAIEEFKAFMGKTGTVAYLKEDLIDVGCSLSGCGPAFVYMFIEALADGAVSCGLSRQDAIKYAAETLIGASEMVLKTGEHPEKLKDDVCSPKGSTIYGVEALEKRAFRSAASEAVIACFNRLKEMN